MEERTILLEDRRAEVAALVEWVTQGAAAVTLLHSGMNGFAAPGAGGLVLAGVEVATAVALLAAIFREVRLHRHPREEAEEPGISWTGLLAAAVLFVECAHSVLTGGTLSLAKLAMGGVTLVQALLQPRIAARRQSRRFLRVSAAGIELGTSRVRRFSVPWSEVAAVRIDGGHVVVETRTGEERRIRLSRYHNGGEIAELLRESAAPRGLLAEAGARGTALAR